MYTTHMTGKDFEFLITPGDLEIKAEDFDSLMTPDSLPWTKVSKTIAPGTRLAGMRLPIPVKKEEFKWFLTPRSDLKRPGRS